MIKRINRIKNLGVFEDYARDTNLQDFNKKNILYGWNYTGKSTLSRLFSYLNKGAVINTDYQNVEFEIELTDGTKITQQNKDDNHLFVKVFNSDFIRENLRFDSDDKKITGITFEVGENIAIRKEIEENIHKIKKGKQKKNNNRTNIDRFSEFENTKFTNEARRIKNDCFNSLIEFNKGHLKNILDFLQNSINQYTNIDSTELNKIKSDALAQDTKTEIISPKPMLAFDTLLRKVTEICQATPTRTIEDNILSDEDFYNWAQDGLRIYSNKKPKVETCAFCGQQLTNSRIEYLNAFYSNEAAKLRAEIEDIKHKICEEKQVFANLEWGAKSPNDFVDSLKDKYASLKGNYGNLKDEYNALLDTLNEKLVQKYDNLFIDISIGNIDSYAKTQMEEWINEVEQIIQKHNDIVNNFATNRDTARDKYKKYLVATFLENENYFEVKRKSDIEERGQKRFDKIIQSLETKNIQLTAQLKSIIKGKEKLDVFIKRFLNRNDISIEVTEDDKFQIKRGNHLAKNLSEGEKTAIAFAHFMVMLDSIGNEMQNQIVFIDDPISSLDANHIAQVSSLINSFFFRQGLDSAQPDKYCNYFNQLFISTHNFEFFSFLNDANRINKKGTLNKYFIKRINETKSIITELPKAFGKCKSEYVYLFLEINKFKKGGCKEEDGYLMPNIIRRFLEIYTLIKLPGSTDEIDNRIKILYPDFDKLKILHNFSHFTSFERVVKHSEIIQKLPEIVEDLYKILEQDKSHLDSLYKGIEE